ncbi:ATP-dependent RNA helicase [Russula earlei]|uniref:ATP-dependent RNA helicase n=1 Tax=Russula earlei TaxID=71964 RepID=A0ACC0U5R9_9AGAM|nr:ATP-dependent RNA helicase [Russula earlei]
MPAAAKKRRRSLPVSDFSKKRKTVHTSLDDLSWRPVVRSRTAGLDFDEGLLGLEEVEGVQFLVDDSKRTSTLNPDEGETGVQDGIPSIKVATRTTPDPGATLESRSDVIMTFDSEHLLPAWHFFGLHPQLYAALHSQNFVSPTPIQSRAIPKACSGRDVIGVAETGSGKTLAYGLPILHELLTGVSTSSSKTKCRRPLRALVLAPTRELALQVSAHINTCLNHHEISAIADGEPKKGKRKASDKGKEKGHVTPHAPPPVSVAAIVGGMSMQKQARILRRGVDVLVATPGRLWDILDGDDELAEDLKNLRFLVLDEADRMIETGHFAELDNILKLTQRRFRQAVTDPEFHSEDPSTFSPNDANSSPPMQTFVFSATLSKELQQNLKKGWRPKGLQRNDGRPASTLDDLLLRLDFRDPEPEIIDISPKGGVVPTLKESKIECLATDKDVHLYHFLLRYPGRTLVFLSSIDGIRRLSPLLELLRLPTFLLHSQLEQRQRLKNLDRFKSHAHSILLSTDIAARGLDIPLVSHVVHYQIPRTVDTYIHRTGRTARAQRDGFSLLMCAPDERRVVRTLFGNLGRQVTDIPEMIVDHHFLDKLKRRIRVAKEIDALQHQENKANHEKKWMHATAEALDIDLDSDYHSEDGHTKQLHKAHDVKSGQLKAELRELLKQPLVARGVSTRYITSGSRPIAHDILTGENHEGMIGVRKTDPGSDVVPRKGKTMTKGLQRHEFEEWTGIN